MTHKLATDLQLRTPRCLRRIIRHAERAAKRLGPLQGESHQALADAAQWALIEKARPC